jgi:hypothetical protein
MIYHKSLKFSSGVEALTNPRLSTCPESTPWRIVISACIYKRLDSHYGSR